MQHTSDGSSMGKYIQDRNHRVSINRSYQECIYLAAFFLRRLSGPSEYLVRQIAEQNLTSCILIVVFHCRLTLNLLFY
jgi:hypothetical protein